MAGIREELWNIFTYYTLHGNPRDPSRINSMQFLKLCRESMLFDPSMVEEPLTQSIFHVLLTAALKKKGKVFNIVILFYIIISIFYVETLCRMVTLRLID